jgi:hypothetical protein
MRWILFSLVFTLQILLTLPRFRTTCQSKTAYTWFLYFSHHILDVFLFWSFLFLTTQFEHLVHLLILLGVVIHWFTNNNLCVLTVMMNEECGYPENEWLDSLKNMLGLRNINEYFHFIWMLLIALQDVYKLTV